MEKSIKVFFGFSVPRKGRMVVITPDTSPTDLIAASYLAFGTSPDEPYGVFVCEKATQQVLGSVADASLGPFETVTTLESSGVAFEMVFIKLADMAAPAPRAELDEQDYDDVRVTTTRYADEQSADQSIDQTETSTVDPQSLNRAALNKLADKVARRIAKLTQYAHDRSSNNMATDHKMLRKVARARADIDKYSSQLIAIEEKIAELDGNEDSSDESDLLSYRAAHEAEPSTPRKRRHKKRAKAATQDDSSESMSTSSRPDSLPPNAIERQCGMCGDQFAFDPQRPRWVFVPSVYGCQRLDVCSSCRKSAKKSIADLDLGSVAKQPMFEARRISAIGPPTPMEYNNLHVPRYFDNKQNVHNGLTFIVPDIVVSRYKNVGTLHVSHLHRQGGVLVPNASPLRSMTTVGTYVLSYHDNDTLQVFDATSDQREPSLLNCEEAFSTDTAGKSRALIANERWVIVASQQLLCVWAWRVVLGASAANPDKAPGLIIQLDEYSGGVRGDFSSLVGHHLVLGSNHSFTVWDVLQGVCCYRFSFRQSNATLSSFYQIKFTGESVVTQEASGVRVWHIFGKGGALKPDDAHDGEPFVPATAAPLITPCVPKSVFSCIYVDNDYLLIGDTLGCVRIRPTKMGLSKSARRAATKRSTVSDDIDQSPQSKADKLLGAAAVDADGAPIEYICSRNWTLRDSGKSKKKSSSRKAAAVAASNSPLLGSGAHSGKKIVYLSIQAGLVYCVQADGTMSTWPLTARDSDSPEHGHRSAGVAQYFSCSNGTLIYGGQRGASEEEHGDDSSRPDSHLAVVVYRAGEPALNMGSLRLPALPNGAALLLFATDVADTPGVWQTAIVRRFAALDARAQAQNCQLVGYSEGTGDQECEQRERSIAGARLVSLRTLRAALGSVAPANALAPRWFDASLDAPRATMVAMPGAQAMNPISVAVLLQLDGFLSLYVLSARYGATASPAKVWSFVAQQLLAHGRQQRHGEKTKKPGLKSAMSGLFKK